MTTDYERVSHLHCWAQGKEPACGIPLEKHTQCCLCDLPITTQEKKCCEECRYGKVVGSFTSGDLQRECSDASCPCHTTQEEEWEREFEERFGKRFSEIARQADRGDDEGYGKGLARLHIDIRKYIRTTRQQAVAEDRKRLSGGIAQLFVALDTLSQIKDGKTLFEHSPTDDQECYEAWIALNNARKALKALLTTNEKSV